MRLAIAFLLSAVLALSGCSDYGAKTSTTSASNSAPAHAPAQRIEINYTGGKVTSNPAGNRVQITKNNVVELVVTSDKADEVHLHGYDKTLPLRANQPGQLTFTADISGVFEVELHHANKPLIQLAVE